MQGTWNAAYVLPLHRRRVSTRAHHRGLFSYGFQPLAFKALWSEMYSHVRQASPETIIVWAPNLGIG